MAVKSIDMVTATIYIADGHIVYFQLTVISNSALAGESSSSSILLPVIGGVIIAIVISLLVCVVIVVIVVKKRHLHNKKPERSAVNNAQAITELMVDLD